MIRYFTILTWEHYTLVNKFNTKFGEPILKEVSMKEMMENICKDFGLPFKTVLEHSKLEEWDK